MGAISSEVIIIGSKSRAKQFNNSSLLKGVKSEFSEALGDESGSEQ